MSPFEAKGYEVSEVRNHSYETLDQPMRYRILKKDGGQQVFVGSWRDANDWIAAAPAAIET
ncbi:MAG: hypothetical protein ACK4NW_12530 [Roseinatronobacter sp.]